MQSWFLSSFFRIIERDWRIGSDCEMFYNIFLLRESSILLISFHWSNTKNLSSSFSDRMPLKESALVSDL